MRLISILLFIALLTTGCANDPAGFGKFFGARSSSDDSYYSNENYSFKKRLDEIDEKYDWLDFQEDNLADCAHALTFNLDTSKIHDCDRYASRDKVTKRVKFIKNALERTKPTQEELEILKKRKVRIGMTKDMALVGWGIPKHKNNTTSRYGTRSQWVYENSYLYFNDGILTTIQN